ncbi:hypothetical protein LCGC14_0224650 [marine sediment metagenome]|uniref:Uncharacterized protein n=1 Tax=marine sediment metagenome TaxID=412755 RepID=A0A0F9WWX3_9ZZZZ|nr:hypothetical protein [bacterium]
MKKSKSYEKLEQEKLILEGERFSVIRNCVINKLELYNCQNCLILSNTLGRLYIGDKIPDFNDKRFFRKIRRKRYRNKYGSNNNIITNNIVKGYDII